MKFKKFLSKKEINERMKNGPVNITIVSEKIENGENPPKLTDEEVESFREISIENQL